MAREEGLHVLISLGWESMALTDLEKTSRSLLGAGYAK